MWLLYNHDVEGYLKSEAVRAGCLQNYKWLRRKYPEPLSDEMDYSLQEGNEEIARYFFQQKPDLTNRQIAMAVRKFTLPFLQEIHKSYGELFNSSRVVINAAKACRIDVLEWLQGMYDCHDLAPNLIHYSLHSHEVVQWLCRHKSTMTGYIALSQQEFRHVDERVKQCLVEHGIRVMGSHDENEAVDSPDYRDHPELIGILTKSPFDPIACERYCQRHHVIFTEYDLTDPSLTLPAVKWINGHNVIAPSKKLLGSASTIYDRDPALLEWLLAARNDEITGSVLELIAQMGNTNAYEMIYKKFPRFVAPRKVLLSAAIYAPFHMLKLLFRLYPYFRRRKVLRWLYRFDWNGEPRLSILDFLEKRMELHPSKETNGVRGAETALVQQWCDPI